MTVRLLYLIFQQLMAWLGGAGPEFTIEECGNPVGAELAIHGGDLKHCWTVAVGHDRRSWRYDCYT